MNKGPYGQGSVGLEQALKLIDDFLKPLEPQEIPLAEAVGCVLAAPITAKINNPPFPRSPYDGYALHSADSAGANRENPSELPVVGQSFAGKLFADRLEPGETVLIATGACIPQGADCVIRQEDTDRGKERVKFFVSGQPYENYCHEGEDFLCGSLLAAKGELVNASLASVAAGAGYDKLLCVPPVYGAVLSSGSELYTQGLPLPKGHIYDSNSIYIQGRLKELGVKVAGVSSVGDNLAEISSCIERSLAKADILIITGGVSVGEYDLIPQALRSLSADIIFHGVHIKPGMPGLFALLNHKPIMALSGNPFAAAVDFEMLARPALAALAGNCHLLPRQRTAVLKAGYTKKGNLRRFVRGRLEGNSVSIPPSQSNGQMRAMIGCNCLIDIPADTISLAAGAEICVYLL